MQRLKRHVLPIVCVIFSFAPGTGHGDDAADTLGRQLSPFLNCLSGRQDAFSLRAEVEFPDGASREQVVLKLDRIDGESFDLHVTHRKYELRLHRTAERTAMVLPRHQVAFVGSGVVEDENSLRPTKMMDRLVGAGTVVGVYLPLIAGSDPDLVALALQRLVHVKSEAPRRYSFDNQGKLRFDETGAAHIEVDGVTVSISVTDTPQSMPLDLDQFRIVSKPRDELERSWSRGLRRALEVLAPSPQLKSPLQVSRRVPHGELRWVDGHRVVLLWGSPAEVGRAHGELLKAEAGRCVDSVLHMFGVAQAIESGRWFSDDLAAAYQRLEPHIPDDHKVETAALANAAGWDPKVAQHVNVFPELFHCSGFAVFGRATQDGKLYHGRVLDYMTTIGLQDSATTFIIAVNGKIPFATVGYGGFIGSVSGMNADGISLGEMGGRGEGKWDGVPMATLMRRALEECDTLSQVKSLWSTSPRTCEYYYVFADGKTNEAVGVAATPEAIQFVEPGEAHPLLGEGIEDAVVMSAGSRLEVLRERVQQKHGQIDADVGKWLMSRPVAMKSNLHNVLFVPEDGVLYVANADHDRPAAERPYVKLDLRKLLRDIPERAVNTTK